MIKDIYPIGVTNFLCLSVQSLKNKQERGKQNFLHIGWFADKDEEAMKKVLIRVKLKAESDRLSKRSGERLKG